jgi:hypothetical protein
LIRYLIKKGLIELSSLHQIEEKSDSSIKILSNELTNNYSHYDKILFSFDLELNNLENANVLKISLIKSNQFICFDKIGYENGSKIFILDEKTNYETIFIEIFSLVYFPLEKLVEFYDSKTKSFDYDTLKFLPKEIASSEYYRKTTGHTNEEVLKCTEFFKKKIEKFVNLVLVEECALTEIKTINNTGTYYFKIWFKNEETNKLIKFCFEFEPNSLFVKFSIETTTNSDEKAIDFVLLNSIALNEKIKSKFYFLGL